MLRFLPLLVLSLLTACAQPTTISPRATQQEIAMEEARQKQYLQEERMKGLVHGVSDGKSSKLGPRIKSIASKITPSAVGLCADLGMRDPSSCAYEINVKNTSNSSENLNAYADGKTINITSAMARFADDDSELAYIIAHEAAHNIMGHVDSTKRNALGGMLIGAIADAIAARQGYDTGGDFTKAGMEGGVLAYSVDFEEEADYIGLYILARAGYEYQHVPEFWRRMSLENPESIYLSTTHPSNASRYVVMRKVIQEIDAKKSAGQRLAPQFKPQKNALGN